MRRTFPGRLDRGGVWQGVYHAPAGLVPGDGNLGRCGPGRRAPGTLPLGPVHRVAGLAAAMADLAEAERDSDAAVLIAGAFVVVLAVAACVVLSLIRRRWGVARCRRVRNVLTRAAGVLDLVSLLVLVGSPFFNADAYRPRQRRGVGTTRLRTACPGQLAMRHMSATARSTSDRPRALITRERKVS
jgi:hypothetical protein